MNDKCPKLNFGKRLTIEILLGALLNFMVSTIAFPQEKDSIEEYLFMIFMFVLVAEPIFLFNTFLERRWPWHKHTRLRAISLTISTIVWFFVSKELGLILGPHVLPNAGFIDPHSLKTAILVSVLVIIIFVIGLIAHNHYKSLIYYTIENEGLKQKQLELNYRSLQDKLNPHFLFNSFSTLKAIIDQNNTAAINFTQNLSDVYRYVLVKNDEISVPVSEEIEFIETFAALHRERLGEGFQFSIDVTEMDARIPPLSLQLLVENAIKHNMATLRNPLYIRIYNEGAFLIVENNLQSKYSHHSTHTGLSNLIARYSFLTDKKVDVSSSDGSFSVKIPLLFNGAKQNQV